jgi:hypothetical protein
MEYVRGSLRLDLDAEALSTSGFVIYLRGIPEDLREQVVADVTRAWKWAGFDVETIGP